MRPIFNFPNPLAVALGLAETESQFTYAAADTMMQLSWSKMNMTTSAAQYEIVIFDTGFQDGRRQEAPSPNERESYHGTISTELAACLLYICANADEPNDAGTQPESDDFLAHCYARVEKWITDINLPRNLRPIP